jgi:hypothetical protein
MTPAEFVEKYKREHYYCADNWYSCPLALDGCADDSQPKDKCNCGADKWNKEMPIRLTALLAAERERCAKISDKMSRAAEKILRERHDDDAAAQYDTAEEIAAAIRRQ